MQIKKFLLKKQLIFLMAILCFNCATTTIYAQVTEESTFQKANKLFKQNRLEEGKQLVDIGLEESPYDADLLMLNGKYYHEKKNNDKARFYLTKSLQYDPNNVDAKQILTNVEIEDKHYSSAICYINELLEVNPYWKGLWRKKIEVYRLQGNTVEANRLLKRISQIYPEDKQIKVDYRYNLQNEIRTLKKAGKVDAAIKLTEELMSLDKSNPNLYLGVINTYLADGDYEKGLVYANQALTYMPNNSTLITKKASILADSGNVDEALSFIKSKNKGTNGQLTLLYNQLLLQSAREQNDKDPYTLYGKILESSPGNEEALDYMLNASLSKGNYTEAENYVNMAKKSGGENKKVLSKEYTLYTKMGNDAKANNVLTKLYNRFPEDTDIRDNYISNQYKLARQNMLDQQYREAIIQLTFLTSQEKNEYTEISLQELTEAYLKTGRKQEAFTTSQKLISEYPDSIKNKLLKVSVLTAMDREEEALAFYEDFLKSVDKNDYEFYLIGYDEMGSKFLKKLTEAGQVRKVFEIADRIITVNPKSELAYHYAINTAFAANDSERVLTYSKKAIETYPDNIVFKTKYAEALSKNAMYDQAGTLLKELLVSNSYNKEIINTYTQYILEYGKILYKNKDANQLMAVTEDALQYNPNNKELLHQKGLAYLLLKDYVHAYEFMKFYTPSSVEQASFIRELEWLQNKAYKNQVQVNYLRSRFSDEVNVSSIATIDYTRFESSKNTYVARLNYAGREEGAGILAQAEWTHVLNNKTYFLANAGFGTRYFAKIIANASVFRSFGEDYEVELGLGHRYLPKVYTLTNLVCGVSHKTENMWLNAKGLLFVTQNSLILYNAVAQSKFYVFTDGKSHLTAMASLGTVPETGALDLSLYDTYDAFNTMVGGGGQYMVNKRLTVSVLGNWYNFKFNGSQYSNLYNLYLTAIYSL